VKRVERSEILDYVTYGEQRDAISASALRAQSVRRVLVGEYFTFLFENHETVLYQVQEMMHFGQIVKEDDIQRALDTYNELIHPGSAVRCTLLVDDEVLRDEKQWSGFHDRIYAKLPDGSLASTTWDLCHPAYRGGPPVSAGDLPFELHQVEYLSFDLGPVQYLSFSHLASGHDPRAPVAIGIKMTGIIEAETVLSEALQEALQADLSAG
jgi:hypothetical protein